jgi:hypothetical protein
MAICMGAETDRVYTSTDIEQGRGAALGDLFFDTGGKVWKFVQYDTGAGSVAAVAGQVAYYYTLDGYKNHQVTSDLSDSVEIGAGVLAAAPGDGEYCWIQIKGPATLSIALTAGADGDPLTPTGATDGTLDVSAGVTDNVCAIAGDISDQEIICDFPF